MTNLSIFKRIVCGAIAGGIIGSIIFWLVARPSLWKWIILSTVAGIFFGLMWPLGRSVVIRLRIEDWRLEQVEIQGIRFTSAGMQRRVAWRLFVEMDVFDGRMVEHNAIFPKHAGQPSTSRRQREFSFGSSSLLRQYARKS